MNFNRHWIAICTAGLCLASIARAQEDSAPAAPAEPAISGSIFSSGGGASSSFSPSVFSAEPSGSTEAPASDAAAGTGAASAFGSGGGGQDSAPSFSVPGLFGQGTQTFTGGSGRLARPRFETSISLSMGYDDNIFLTPTDGQSFISDVTQVLVDPGNPGGQPIIEERQVFTTLNTEAPGSVVTGVTEARAPVFENRFTMTPPPKRQGSLLTQASFGIQSTIATRRTVLVLDASAGAVYYWDREGDAYDPNARLSLTFLQRITPRLNLAAVVSSAYLKQPDLSIANTPDRPTRGAYLSTVSRLSLAYRVTPRFSLTASTGYNSLRFEEPTEQVGDYDDITVGLEASYLWSPRFSVLTEYRHSMIAYDLNEVLNSSTDFLLVGSEFTVNRRLTGSFRAGQSIRSFETGGDSASTPYLETVLRYRTSSRSQLQWTSRFGFEEPNAAGQERRVLRTGINYQYAFTPRLVGLVAVNFLQETSSVEGVDEDYEQSTLDSYLTLNYTLTRHFGLNFSYSFTSLAANRENTDYYRNRVFFGVDYRF